MGDYLTPGTTYADGGEINGPNLNAHVADAVFKPTAISARTLKDPAVLADEFLINDAGTLKKVTLQQLHDLILYPGCVVQTAYAKYTANTNLTAIIPSDDSIPQNTEGTELISLSITPRFSTSIIKIEFNGFFAINTLSAAATAALFRGGIVDALQATQAHGDVSGINTRQVISFIAVDSPATVSSVSYSIRIGPNTGIMRMNGATTARIFGGAAATYLILQEIKV